MADAADATMASSRFVGIDVGVACVVASSPLDNRDALTVNTNSISARSTPSAVSFDGKMRHVGDAAEGRYMSAPKQTLTHLPLMLGDADAWNRRAEKYLWLSKREGNELGPVTFDGEDLRFAPCGPLAVLLRNYTSFAVAPTTKPTELCLAVHDYLTDAEVAVVRDAAAVAELNCAVVRHSDAIAVAFVQSAGAKLFPEGTSERTVAFVDIGVSHGTVAVVKYAAPPPAEEGSPAGEVTAEFLYRKSDESLGVQAFVSSLVGEIKQRIELKHKCAMKLKSKAGQRVTVEAVRLLKQLSMLPDADLNLEALMPEGPDGPEIDVTLKFTRDALETCAASAIQGLRALVKEGVAAAPEGSLEAVELVGGGSRIPAVQALLREIVGESVPLRFGLDSSSCVAAGAAAWAGGRHVVPAMPAETGGLDAEKLAAVKAQEARIEAIHSKEVERLDKRNQLESYVYQVQGWMDGKDGELLNPSEVRPFLDKVILWFEDSEEDTSLETFVAKLEEVEAFVKERGGAYFAKQSSDREAQQQALEKATEEERQRRKDLGMDFDKDERHMKKEDRLRLAGKNKDEGNDMFKAQKYDDAIRRYKKAIDHVCRPEAASNFTPDEAEEAKKIKISCHLNSAQCYIKGGEAVAASGPNATEPFYKKAKTSCDDVLTLDDQNIKGFFRRSLCNEKIGDLQEAMKDIKKGLAIKEEDADLKKSQERLEKLYKKQKDGQKKVYGKMFG